MAISAKTSSTVQRQTAQLGFNLYLYPWIFQIKCVVQAKTSARVYCLHPNSAMTSHMSHWNNQDPTWALKSLLFRPLCPTRSSVMLHSKMNSAQKFYSWWKLYLKCFSTVLSGVSHFACVTKQTSSARSYRSWLHKTTLNLEHPWTKFDP